MAWPGRRKKSQETRAKMRAAALARWEREPNPMQGRKHDDATRAIMANRRRAWWAAVREKENGSGSSPEPSSSPQLGA